MHPTLEVAEGLPVPDATESADYDDGETYANTESVSDNMSKMSSEDRNRKMEEMVVEILSNMMPAKPDIIRAARAGRATFCCGRALRSSRGKRGDFRTSFQTVKIAEFWSHSWHGSRWSKIVTAIYLNNGLIAPLIATICAMIAASLFVAGVLPMEFVEWTDNPWIPQYQYPLVSYWAKATGFIVYCFILLFWQRAHGIFLDTLCIKQDDTQWKALALLSMPALLKSADSLLVLWDPTYTRRLWCCFEIAAFLHSRPIGQKAHVRVRPTLLGVGFISFLMAPAIVLLALAFVPSDPERRTGNHEVMWPLMAGCSFVAFYFSVMQLRKFFRSVEMIQSELQDFRFDNCSCHCCATNHQFSQTCDRRILTICISKWFGSIDRFEDLMRSEVLACLTEQLATNILTYREFVVMSLPVLWHFLDSASEPLDWYFRTHTHKPDLRHEIKVFARELFRGLGWTFGALPTLFLVTSRLACLLRRRVGRSYGAKICWDLLIICSILLVAIALFVAFLVLEQVCGITLLGILVFDAILFTCTFLLFRCLPDPMRLKAQAVYQRDGHETDTFPSPEEMEVSVSTVRNRIQL